MRLDGNEEIEIARRPAVQACLPFPGKPDARAFLDPRWNIHLERAFLLHESCAMTGLARIADDAPLAAAGRARALDGEETLLCANFANAGAGGALLGLRTGFRA